LFKESIVLQKRKTNLPQKRFDFAKLADEAVKDKEESSNSSLSLDTSSNRNDLSISSTPSPHTAPAAITSGVSLLNSTPLSYVFVYLFVWTSGAKISWVVVVIILIIITLVCERQRRRRRRKLWWLSDNWDYRDKTRAKWLTPAYSLSLDN